MKYNHPTPISIDHKFSSCNIISVKEVTTIIGAYINRIIITTEKYWCRF